MGRYKIRREMNPRTMRLVKSTVAANNVIRAVVGVNPRTMKKIKRK